MIFVVEYRGVDIYFDDKFQATVLGTAVAFDSLPEIMKRIWRGNSRKWKPPKSQMELPDRQVSVGDYQGVAVVLDLGDKLFKTGTGLTASTMPEMRLKIGRAQTRGRHEASTPVRVDVDQHGVLKELEGSIRGHVQTAVAQYLASGEFEAQRGNSGKGVMVQVLKSQYKALVALGDGWGSVAGHVRTAVGRYLDEEKEFY